MADTEPSCNSKSSFAPCSDSTVSDTISVLEQFFTPDQSQSLQQLFLVHQSYLFKCLYDMETHLEISLEELKKRQARTEIQIAKLNFLGESTRCNVVSLAKRVDGLDNHPRKKRKKASRPQSPDRDVETSTHEKERETHAPKQKDNFSSPGYSDTSTLPDSSPGDTSKKPSGSFPSPTQQSFNATSPHDHHSNSMNLDSDTPNDPSSHRTEAKFALAPTVSSTFSPATWEAVATSNTGSNFEFGLDSGVQETEPDVAPATASPPPPPSDPSPEQEKEKVQEQEQEQERALSHPQFPSPSPDHMDMDFGTADQDPLELLGNSFHPTPEPEHDSEDEEVIMQLVNNVTSSTTPSPPCPALDNGNLPADIEPKHSPSESPVLPPLPASLLPRLSASPYPSPPRTSSHNQAPEIQELHLPQPSPLPPAPQPPSCSTSPHQRTTSRPAIPHDQAPEAQEPADLGLTLGIKKDPQEAKPYFCHELARSFSPLSDLTEATSSNNSVTDSAVMDDSVMDDGNNMEVPRDSKGESDDSISTSGLNGIALSDVLTKSVRLRLEEKRVPKSKKKAMLIEKKRGRKSLEKGKDAKQSLAESKKKKSVDEKAIQKEVKGKRKKKVVWPEMYAGDEEDEFYRKVIECDVCGCWYHYGCAGIKPNDVRLGSSESYQCPVCTTLGDNKMKGNAICSRPDCGRSQSQPGEYVVSGIVGRKLRYDENGNVKFLYLVTWAGYSVADATWEFKSTLQEPHKLIQDFEEACERENLPLNSPSPILLKEAVEVGWRHVLAYTDPIGVQVPLEGLPAPKERSAEFHVLVRMQA